MFCNIGTTIHRNVLIRYSLIVIAVSLARAGVGRLILIDFDKVEVSNLHRQQYKASQTGGFKTEALINVHTGETPYNLPLESFGEDTLKALQLRRIVPDEVNLTPKLIQSGSRYGQFAYVS